MSKRDGRVAFYAINSRWLGPNHVNVSASDTEAALQMSLYDGKKNTLKWEKYVSSYVKYHINLKNLKEYGNKALIKDLLNGTRCDNLSTAVAFTIEDTIVTEVVLAAEARRDLMMLKKML